MNKPNIPKGPYTHGTFNHRNDNGDYGAWVQTSGPCAFDVLCPPKMEEDGQAAPLVQAIAALPQLLTALERLNTWLVAPDTSKATLEEMRETTRTALLAAGYAE